MCLAQAIDGEYMHERTCTCTHFCTSIRSRSFITKKTSYWFSDRNYSIFIQSRRLLQILLKAPHHRFITPRTMTCTYTPSSRLKTSISSPPLDRNYATPSPSTREAAAHPDRSPLSGNSCVVRPSQRRRFFPGRPHDGSTEDVCWTFTRRLHRTFAGRSEDY